MTDCDEISFEDVSLLDVSLTVEIDANNNESVVNPQAGHSQQPATSTPKKKKEKRKLSCNDCPYYTTSSGNLSRHKRSVHKKEKVQCTHCNKYFSAMYDLRQHLRCIHNKMRLLCELCSAQFNSRSNLARHRAMHHSDHSKFTCEKCGQNFYERSAYIGHMNKELGSKPYKCTTCELSFSIENSLRRHQKTCKNNQMKTSYKCDICGVELNSKAALDEHMKGKHGPKNLVCACGKSFSWRPSFGRHKKSCKIAKH